MKTHKFSTSSTNTCIKYMKIDPTCIRTTLNRIQIYVNIINTKTITKHNKLF